MQCVRVVQLNCVKVQCMLCEWECDVGELFAVVVSNEVKLLRYCT